MWRHIYISTYTLFMYLDARIVQQMPCHEMTLLNSCRWCQVQPDSRWASHKHWWIWWCWSSQIGPPLAGPNCSAPSAGRSSPLYPAHIHSRKEKLSGLLSEVQHIPSPGDGTKTADLCCMDGRARSEISDSEMLSICSSSPPSVMWWR